MLAFHTALVRADYTAVTDTRLANRDDMTTQTKSSNRLVPQFLGHCKDGCDVPKERRYDEEIYVDTRHPWNVLTPEYVESGLVPEMALYKRTPTGDFLISGVVNGRSEA